MYKGIVLIGPPFAGKGTQGKSLGALSGYHHISSGDVFRNLDPSDELGGYVKGLIDSGDFVPDELTMRVFSAELEKRSGEGMFDPMADRLVLDGIPRTVAQIELLEKVVSIDRVLHLYIHLEDVSDLKVRLMKRASEEGRPDDSEDVFERRISTYLSQTQPVIRAYEKRGLVSKVYGMGSPDAIFRELARRI